MHPIGVPGTPDFYFGQVRLAVFVDGCFWHGCRHCCRFPKKNSDYWKQKISRNKLRDKAVNRRLAANAIDVMRLWEHAISVRGNLTEAVGRISRLVSIGRFGTASD
jgi:DNA mismatch endonuclease (patch repair protein)